MSFEATERVPSAYSPTCEPELFKRANPMEQYIDWRPNAVGNAYLCHKKNAPKKVAVSISYILGESG